MKRLGLFPDTTKIENDTLTVDGQGLGFLADEYGTPLYIYDSETMDNVVTEYKRCLASHYPGLASVTYAGKAYLSTALAQWTQLHGLWVDCTGEGEISIAKVGGVPRERLLVHGVNKSDADLKSAFRHAGTIVVDNLSEHHRFAALIARSGSQTLNERMSFWLRLQPGLAVTTQHAYTQTGQHNSKFGMDGEELMEAVSFCKENGLSLQDCIFTRVRNSATLSRSNQRLCWRLI